MKKAYQFRIYPSKNQEVKLNRTLSTCRHLYNESLAERKRQSELNELERTLGVTPWGKPEWMNYYDQANNLSREQIHLSKKKLRSKNRNKQRIIVAKVHRTIRNQRKDFAHKTSRKLVEEYDHIVFEDLQIKNMMRNHHLAKSISDAGWSQLISFTKSKAEYAGKIVELVNPGGTSQVCICGHPVPKKLSMRTHKCSNCGLIAGRDHVSANIIESRSSTAGTAGFQACLSNLNRDTMKQEATLLVGW